MAAVNNLNVSVKLYFQSHLNRSSSAVSTGCRRSPKRTGIFIAAIWWRVRQALPGSPCSLPTLFHSLFQFRAGAVAQALPAGLVRTPVEG